MRKPHVTITDKDRGYSKLVAEVATLKDQPYVKIGVLGETALEGKRVRLEDGTETTEDSVKLVDVATFHEFGGAGDHPPQRSFIRSTVDGNRAKYDALIKKLHADVMTFKLSINQALGLLGERIEADIRRTFTKNDWPPLANPDLSRAGRKKGNTKFKGHRPLIDTGQLWRSIRNLVVLKRDY